MDLIIYFVVFMSIGVYNIYKNEGLNMLEESTVLAEETKVEKKARVGLLDGMEMGSNPYLHYNKDAFCKILDQFNLR